MKHVLVSVFVAGVATAIVAVVANAQVRASASHTIVIKPKSGCCPCAQRWAYPQVQNPSLRLVDGQPLTFAVMPDRPIDAYVSVENVSPNSVTFGVRIDTSRKSVEHRVNFCSGMACYPSFVIQSDEQGQVTLQPGERDHTFKLQFDPQGVSGQSVIGVVIYNVAEMSDYISFDVTFEATTSSVDQPLRDVTIAPNPASDVVYVSAVAGARVEILDALGRLVHAQVMPSDRTAMSITELPSGAYRLVVRNGERSLSQPLQIIR
ncbi:MAG: T9SS type A sorting domain-containing protein [Chlorobi bacterium]|nr:T9SS type A sorting domain-containing protein [Chlorobiota bacterium]